MTHGITSKTAKLAYMDESGALNEAYSDFFGKMIARDGSWVVGASLSLSPDFRGIRDLRTPGSFTSTVRDGNGTRVTRPQPASVSELVKRLDETSCDESNDRCWVHFNSTVPSHASYLIYQAIGKAKAEALYYLTLTQFLTSNSSFHEAAESTLKACGELMKLGRLTADDCKMAEDAFYEVGML
jgi:Zn-dependent metalloprotease